MMIYFASFRNERTDEEFTDETLCSSCYDELTQGDTEEVFDWEETDRTRYWTTAEDEGLIGQKCFLCGSEFFDDNV